MVVTFFRRPRSSLNAFENKYAMKKVTKDLSLGTLLQWWCINLQTANFLGDILVERRFSANSQK